MMRLGSRRVAIAGAAAAAAILCCVGPDDVPSNVHDLRLLGVRLDPPELMAPTCDRDNPLNLLPSYAQEVTYTALVADPAGGGRAIEAELTSCPATDAGICDRSDEVRVLSPSQPVASGEIQIDLGMLAFTGAPDDLLLLETLARDPYGGLGGVRLPLVLHLEAGEEEIFGDKLMLFTCRFFPEMNANVNPVLPGVKLAGKAWAESELPLLEGGGTFEMEADDFADREEPYTVPSFELQPVHLVESWKIAWHADFGTFQPYETGGVDFGGETSRHRVEWTPPPDGIERDVRFWMVVRDGRGGTSWITRSAHYRP